jgi:hypothetical protein
MATFRCGKCGCHEDTALCNYWSARLREIQPVCSACDEKIGKWHGQFPRLFGAFLVMPGPTSSPRELLASSLRRLQLVEGGPPVKIVERSDLNEPVAVPGDLFRLDDPVPSYTSLTAAPEGGAPALRS